VSWGEARQGSLLLMPHPFQNCRACLQRSTTFHDR
jgi:hypothetical protein